MSEQAFDNNVENIEFIFSGGEMGDLIRSKDWSKTSLGSTDQWQDSLSSTLSICLSSRFPMAIYWGDDWNLLYNDAWRPILGNKHPWALGRPAREVWSEIWDFIAPLLESVRETGEATWRGDELLPMQRFGYTEECYFDYTFNPIRDKSGKINGILNVVQETTYRYLNERRTRLLRELATVSGSARTEENACEMAISALATDKADIPFALIYLVEPQNQFATLISSTGLPEKSPALIEKVDLTRQKTKLSGWALKNTFQSRKITTIDDLTERFGAMPGGLWNENTTQAIVLPLTIAGEDAVAGILVSGVNPRHPLDTDYNHFFQLVAAHISTTLTNARAYSSEKKRAEKLAEIDRAKTEFFSNVSHEFRTPLTLMLSPLEDILNESGNELSDSTRSRLETVNRNSLRLLKLVNNLLDFSRIEAHRQQANFELTDLAQLTAELASTFRSAIENAGMKLRVDCQSLSQPIFVDREMWEKIVLNLLSNAFKFTFDGEIGIYLKEKKDSIELQVSDTGVGIPADQLDDVFKRFHRVRSTRGRTHEGTGIGLSLVQELVKLHDGKISVSSEIGKGATFKVEIPKGKNHLSADLITEKDTKIRRNIRADVFLNEILDQGESESFSFDEELSQSKSAKDVSLGHILLVDDNSDMREYVSHLLETTGYKVKSVANGQIAFDYLKSTERLPDLILSDVMMPVLDGFAFLEKLRSDERTRNIPFVMLSARAGEESKIEGLEAGADDYLIKPFSARELLARVRANLELTRTRRQAANNLRESEERFRRVANTAPVLIWVSDTTGKGIWFNKSRLNFVGRTIEQEIGDGWQENIHPDDLLYCLETYSTAFDVRKEFSMEYRLRRYDGEYRLILDNGVPNFDANGEFSGYIGSCIDITELKQSGAVLERYRMLAEKANDIIWMLRPDGRIVEVNEAAIKAYGYTREEFLQMNVRDLRESSTLQVFNEHLAKAANGGVNFETIHMRRDGTTFPVEVNANGLDFGSERLIMGIVRDITERKQAESRFALLAEISELLRTINNPLDLLFSVSKAIGQHLKVRRCLFNEIDLENDCETIHRDYFNGVVSIAGKHKVSSYSSITSGDMKIGKTVVNFDSKADPRTSKDYQKIYKPNGERSYIAVPLMRNGKWVSSLWVSDDVPRKWTNEEITLLETIAERTWTAIEKLRIDVTLRENEERYRTLFGAVPVAVYACDAKGVIQEFNQQAIELWGRAPKIGDNAEKYCGSFKIYYPDGRFMPHDECPMARVLKGEQIQAEDSEIIIERADGSRRNVIATPRVLKNENGKIIGAINCLYDITERKKAEQEREQLLANEKEIRKQAEEANRLKDEFLATVSHELRTPLNAILGWATMARRDGFDIDAMRRAFEVVERNARNQNQIISDILDVSRIITGKLNLNMQPIDLSAILQAAVDTLRPAIDSRQIKLKLNFSPDSEVVMGDGDRLQQIFWNLLSNAVKFTPIGGNIEIALRYNKNYAEVSVIDDGNGIEPEFLPFVFERFRQADGRSNRKHGGLGLGLAIVRNLVELHGGSVSVESEGIDRGSTFTVRLPLKISLKKTNNSNHSRISGENSTRKNLIRRKLKDINILVVDDQSDALELVDFILTEQGANVFTADCVDKALQIIDTENPQIVISDIGMPEKDGYVLIKEIRSRTNGLNQPILTMALTAYARKEDNRQVLESGFDAYLPKPVEPGVLISEIINLTSRIK